MIGQGLAAVLPGRFVLCGFGAGFCLIACGLGNLFVFHEGQIELIRAFRLRPEPMTVMSVQLVLKLFDLQAQGLDFIGQKTVHRPQLGEVIRGDIQAVHHC